MNLDMSELSLNDEFLQGNSGKHNSFLFYCLSDASRLKFIVSTPKDVAEEPYRVRYEVMEVPISLPFQKPQADKPNPKQGIGEHFFRLSLLVPRTQIRIDILCG